MPSWVKFAQTRGLSLSVDINDEDYAFLYTDADS